MSPEDVIKCSREGPIDNNWKTQGLIFYVPVFFVKEHPHRLCLYNCVQNFHTSWHMPKFGNCLFTKQHADVSDGGGLVRGRASGYVYYLDGARNNNAFDTTTTPTTDTEYWAGVFPNQQFYDESQFEKDNIFVGSELYGLGLEPLVFRPGSSEYSNTASFTMFPFNGGSAMATGHGLVNIENFCREFVSGSWPRVLHLTESSLQDKFYFTGSTTNILESRNTVGDPVGNNNGLRNFSRYRTNVGRINVNPGGTINDFGVSSGERNGANNGKFANNNIAPIVSSSLDQWYATGSLIKRNLTVLPCDNGLFQPNFNLLHSSSDRVLAGTGSDYIPQHDSPMSLFVDREGRLDLSIISLENVLDRPPPLNNSIITELEAYGTTLTGTADPLIQTTHGRPIHFTQFVGSYYHDLVSPDNPDGKSAAIFDHETGYAFQGYTRNGGDNSSPEVAIFTIPDMFYGQKIEEGSVTIRDPYYTGSEGKMSLTLKDDREGGLYRADCKTPHAVWNNVGNIFYDEGVAIIKSPHIAHFGKDYFEFDLKGTQAVHVSTINVFAPEGMLNSSSNPAYLNLSATLNANDTAPEFVYITSINLHDNNFNIIARANLSQPVLKRHVEGFNFKIKLDY